MSAHATSLFVFLTLDELFEWERVTNFAKTFLIELFLSFKKRGRRKWNNPLSRKNSQSDRVGTFKETR